MWSDARQKDNFDSTANKHYSWCISADSLILAARTLWQRIDLVDWSGDYQPEDALIISPALLLYGFGLECLFKALWVHNGNKIAEDGKYLGVQGATDHRLADLADATGFSLSQDERELLKRLSIIITSTGRYPIAKDNAEGRSLII